jgi:hypothetical protein
MNLHISAAPCSQTKSPIFASSPFLRVSKKIYLIIQFLGFFVFFVPWWFSLRVLRVHPRPIQGLLPSPYVPFTPSWFRFEFFCFPRNKYPIFRRIFFIKSHVFYRIVFQNKSSFSASIRVPLKVFLLTSWCSSGFRSSHLNLFVFRETNTAFQHNRLSLLMYFHS